MRSMVLVMVVVLGGCFGASEHAERVNPCDPWEGAAFDEQGAQVRGITQCAVCRRSEDAFAARAAELGCVEAYPLDGCPIDEGRDDCLTYHADDQARFIAASETCVELVERAGSIEGIGGVECGDACRWSDPYAVPVTSDVPQPPPRNIAGGWDHLACCPGTPYSVRNDPAARARLDLGDC